MCDPLPDVRRVIDSFVAQQRMGKVVIGVDDAHLLDPLSAHVVHQLAQTQGCASSSPRGPAARNPTR